MKLSKREKMLIMLLVITGCVAAFSVFILTPFTDDFVKKSNELNIVENQKTAMTQIINDPTIEKSYNEQKKQSEELYGLFYDKINSYNIDEIISDMLVKNSLNVTNMQISPYEVVPIEPKEGETQEEKKESLLLKSTISLAVSGTYTNILAFIDELHEASFCLKVDEIIIELEYEQMLLERPSIRANGEGGYNKARSSMKIFLYGIEKPKLEDEKITEDAQSPQSTQNEI